MFGYVSSYLGNEFTGIELREEQVQLNNERVAGMTAKYIHDDGQNVAKHIKADSQDLLFSCPPYYDLEKYSDLENDASNQDSYEDFIAILENAFKSALTCLKDERFAVIVVGDVRDKKTGFYYNFIDDVKRIFKQNGVPLYNEIILIETGASTALRAARYMETRKVAKMHQNILVFYKGDPKNIKQTFKKIEYASEDLELFLMDSGNEPDED
jgi:DNA modification methylase